jgi:signal transduction histidine kinase
METDAASRRDRLSPWLVDAVIALLIAAVQVTGTTFAGHFQEDRNSLDPLGVAILVAGALVLVVRRRYPVQTFAASAAATLTYLLLDYPRGPIWFAMIVAFATMVMAGHRVAAVVGLGLGYFGFAWLPALVGVEDAPAAAAAIGLAAWLLLLLSVAEVLRARRDRAEASARTREEEARRRVSDERLRIARELHDVVAHNISLINLQAGVALHLIDEQPEQARTALASIKDASKEALVELRSVLGVLRQVDEDAPRDPAPGLGRLPDLVTQANAAGLRVQVTEEGTPRPLPRGLDLAAFRIVQEALTNVSRHAGNATAEVRVAYAADRLDVEVVDDGLGASAAGPTLGSGNGLTGMRERAEAVGGRFEAGPRPGFGWRVRAELPLPDEGEGDGDGEGEGEGQQAHGPDDERDDAGAATGQRDGEGVGR